ncbi:hypothetical protein WMZ97_08820 [Lentibacillus sp. N15]|uniref:hypothetical protein n=1 Tax=Lentibacillus songyuanensis TaxID=3136161 RepID=UPI0031BAF9DC
MQKSEMWIPLITSVGVGAATYYSMTKNNQNFGQAIEKMVPFVSQISGNGNMGNNQQMQMNSSSYGNSGNSQSSQNNQNQHNSSYQMS